MFGYVTANIEELTEEQRTRYKTCYCGLCRQLKKRNGIFGRMTVNYDMTFLILLLASLYEPPEEAARESCIAHPFKKHDYWLCRFTSYAADLNIALAYLKFIDDIKDEKGLLLKVRFGRLVLFGAYRRVRKKWLEKCVHIEGCLETLYEAEKNGRGADAGANAFGELMGGIFACENDFWARRLFLMGAALGRFIYIMDACCDLEEDVEKGRYNPLAGAESQDNFRQVLTMLIGECAEEFEKLPLEQDVEILRNIIYSGVWIRYGENKK